MWIGKIVSKNMFNGAYAPMFLVFLIVLFGAMGILKVINKDRKVNG